jgi:hypothetical protein
MEWDSSIIDSGPLPGDLKTPYAHLARFIHYAHYVREVPGTQDDPLGFAVTCCALWRILASAAPLLSNQNTLVNRWM